MNQIQQETNPEEAAPKEAPPPAPGPTRATGNLAMLAAAIVWGCSLLLVFMGYRTIGSPWRTFIWAGSLAAIAGVIAVGFRYSWQELIGPTRMKSLGGLALASFVAVLLTHLLGASGAASVTGKQRLAWVEQRRTFETAPDGFPMVKAMAKSQFGLILELAHDDEAFLKTTQRFEGSSSAEMDVLPGYCMLSVWPRGVARSFESQPDAGVEDAVVLKVVVMHELGHCVDMSRDGGSFADATVTPKSVAPGDVASVHDVASLYQAGRKRSTNQWREVYADLFAVGYARIAYPAIAPAIAQWLSGQRRATADTDLIHATGCWVDASTQVAAPQSLADLPGWADRQRAGAPCKLSQNEPG